ncbi:MAG: hypothetical protein RIC95_10385 [Vicingaceae bacterium]
MKKAFLLAASIFGIIVLSFGQAKKAKPGYYYDKQGNKVEGQFVFKIPIEGSIGGEGKLIEYKGGKKEQTLKAKDIEAFVLEGDSFPSLTFMSEIMGSRDLETEFGKIIIEGEITVAALYYTKKNGGSRVVYDKEDFNKQGKMMSLAMSHGLTFANVYKKGANGQYSQFDPYIKKAKEKFIMDISDNSELSKEVSKMGKMKLAMKFTEVVQRYNKWASSKSK